MDVRRGLRGRVGVETLLLVRLRRQERVRVRDRRRAHGNTHVPVVAASRVRMRAVSGMRRRMQRRAATAAVRKSAVCVGRVHAVWAVAVSDGC